ncbi:MAG TPA: Spy/CpxP family protein refolding chaperone [Stellaceae bacterium]|nr:Spy/CpxP family protein refolding chaperone [Stellaceae bacterium]
MSNAIDRASRAAAAALVSSALFTAASLPAAASAQYQPAQYQQQYQGQYRQPPPQQQQAQQPPSADQIIAQLRYRIRPTAAQMPAFNNFANVMRENQRQAQSMQPPPQNADAVQMLSAQARFVQAEAAGLQRMLPALQSLYAQLSPQQRRAADYFFRQGPGGQGQ